MVFIDSMEGTRYSSYVWAHGPDVYGTMCWSDPVLFAVEPRGDRTVIRVRGVSLSKAWHSPTMTPTQSGGKTWSYCFRPIEPELREGYRKQLMAALKDRAVSVPNGRLEFVFDRTWGEGRIEDRTLRRHLRRHR